MRSYQIADFGAPLALAEGVAPTPTGTEVRVKIHACGVCHSDVHLWDGYFDLGGGRRIEVPPPGTLPLTPGHEIVGEVAALGPDATGIAPGARRLVFPWIGCGDCALCRAGDEHLCNRPRALGVNRDGGYADHVLVPHPRYLLDFEGIDEALAATCACSGLTAYSALKKVGRLEAGQSLLIVGAGGVGLAGVRLARAVTGVAPIVADIDADRRAAARDAGAADVIDSSEKGAAKELIGRTGGVAAAIDFVGAESSAGFGDRVLAKGGKLIVVGLFGGELRLSLPLIPMRAVTICGSYVGSLADLAELLDLVRETDLPPMPLAERPLAEATATLKDLRAGNITGRVVLKP
ncbi:MAG: alcohol dehydrogenase catalytic domain-containing protein [Alphaproteobacteria bacterium]